MVYRFIDIDGDIWIGRFKDFWEAERYFRSRSDFKSGQLLYEGVWRTQLVR